MTPLALKFEICKSRHYIKVQVSNLGELDSSPPEYRWKADGVGRCHVAFPLSSLARYLGKPQQNPKMRRKALLPHWSPAGRSAPCRSLSRPCAAAGDSSSATSSRSYGRRRQAKSRRPGDPTWEGQGQRSGSGGAGRHARPPLISTEGGKSRSGWARYRSAAGTHAWLDGSRKFPRWLGFVVPRGGVPNEPAPSEGARELRRPGDQVTHSLGNNRADKLRGARRSQARVCGPDVPSGGPRGGGERPTRVRAPQTPARPPPPTWAALPRTRGTMRRARRLPGPGPRAPSPERRAGRPPLPGPGPRGSRLRPAARRNLDAAPGSARYKGSRVPRVPPAARGYLPPGLCIQPPRLKFTLAGSAGSGFPPTHTLFAQPAARLPRARASAWVRAARAALGLGRPWLPGRAGGPPDRTCGSPQADIFFSLRRPQHRAPLASGSLRASSASA